MFVLTLEFKRRRELQDPNSVLSRRRRERERLQNERAYRERVIERGAMRSLLRDVFWTEGGYVRNEMKKDYIRKHVTIVTFGEEDPQKNEIHMIRQNISNDNYDEEQQNQEKTVIEHKLSFKEIISNALSGSKSNSIKDSTDVCTDNECGICLGEYEKGDLICKSAHEPYRPGYSLQQAIPNNSETNHNNSSNPVLEMEKCPHVFHLDCITEWLMKKRAKGLCPLCRRTFVSLDGLENQYQGSSRSTRARWMARNLNNERMDTSEGSNRTRWLSREVNSSDRLDGSEGSHRARWLSRETNSNDRMDGSEGSNRDRWSSRHINASGDVLNYRMDDIEEDEDASEAQSGDDNES